MIWFSGFVAFNSAKEFLNVINECDFFFGSVVAALQKKSENLSMIFSATNYFKDTISAIRFVSMGIIIGTKGC